MTDTPNESDSRRSVLWDLPLRLFHWLLLAAVVTSIVAVKILDDIDLHVQSGQVILGLLVFRLLWGVIGPSSAQFHRFVRSPVTVLSYLRGKPVTFWGHNPLGALSVIALLGSLVVQVASGLGTDDDIFTTGPLNKFLSDEQVGLANTIHGWNIYLLIFLIATHLLAIAFYRIKKKQNLVAPMITGKASADALSTAPPATSKDTRPFWLSWLTIAIAAAVAWAVFQL